MSVEITGRYLGDLRVEATHGPTGSTLQTVAPVDNEGDGSTFSPTDLVATSLGACMLTVMGIVARRHEVDLRGSWYRVEKHMATEPRRIGHLPIEIHLPAGLEDSMRKRLERAAHTCPVHNTLGSDVDRSTRFVYDV